MATGYKQALHKAMVATRVEMYNALAAFFAALLLQPSLQSHAYTANISDAEI